jgi:hypothetical protein
MTKRVKMPARAESDGRIECNREGEHLLLSCTQDGATTSVRMSDYNAWRAFGLLAIMLKIPLPDAVSKEIKF